MLIGVQVFGELVEFLEGTAKGRLTLELPAGSGIEAMLEKLGIPPHYVGVILVNGKFCGRDGLLKHNDQVQIIPQLEGG